MSKIITKPVTPEYADGWERTFGKKPDTGAADALMGVFGLKRECKRCGGFGHLFETVDIDAQIKAAGPGALVPQPCRTILCPECGKTKGGA